MRKTLDLSRPVQTVGGRPARIICTDKKGPGDFKVIALVSNGEAGERIEMFTLDGKPSSHLCGALVNVPESTTVWLNAYRRTVSCGYASRDNAIRDRGRDAIALIEITLSEEGFVEDFTIHNVEMELGDVD